MSNITISNSHDDYFDTDYGHSGTIDGLKLYQSSRYKGKSLIECGNTKGTTTTTFKNVTFNDIFDVSGYVNNGSDKNFNIKTGSQVTINDVLLEAPVDELPGLEYVMDAQMSDIPQDGVLDKLLIFRNYPLELEDRKLTKKPGTLGAIFIIGQAVPDFGNFTDLVIVYGLNEIEPANALVLHKMKNVVLEGLGNNTDDKDINALTFYSQLMKLDTSFLKK